MAGFTCARRTRRVGHRPCLVLSPSRLNATTPRRLNVEMQRSSAPQSCLADVLWDSQLWNGNIEDDSRHLHANAGDRQWGSVWDRLPADVSKQLAGRPEPCLGGVLEVELALQRRCGLEVVLQPRW